MHVLTHHVGMEANLTIIRVKNHTVYECVLVLVYLAQCFEAAAAIDDVVALAVLDDDKIVKQAFGSDGGDKLPVTFFTGLYLPHIVRTLLEFP